MSTIRARFAPSPTGHLHIGGARTALYNWLFCRREGGTFILRIEDTDVARNVEGAERKLLEDLRWLGLDWEEGPDVGGPCGPYRQSERRDHYHAARDRLIASGQAYYAFDTPEELDAQRRRAASEGWTFRYPRPARPPTAAEADAARREGRPVVVRFKTPYEPVTVRDEILGAVSFPPDHIDDFVIVKSNGWPTYHFAVVVDDAAMGITHVLRAQEHLMNTPRHVLLQRALGCPQPRFAHLPLVLNLDGSKMSKRDKDEALRRAARARLEEGRWTREEMARTARIGEDALARWLEKKPEGEIDADALERLAAAAGIEMPEIEVHDFRRSGYLPEAVVNFIALIGWSPGDDREKMSLGEMTAAFSLERINRTPGRFDREKLLAMNTIWSADLPPQRLLEAFRDFAAVSDSPLRSLADETALSVLQACRGLRTFRDVETKAGSLFAADNHLEYDPAAVRKFLERDGDEGYDMLERVLAELEALEPWSSEALERFFAAFCERHGVRLAEVAQPVRVAVAGRAVSPAIHDTLVLLGKERALRRMRRCLLLRRGRA